MEQFTCVLFLPNEPYVSLLQKQARELERFLQKALSHPHIEVLLQADPKRYPEIKALENTTQRWQRLVSINPVAERFRQLLKGQIVPEEIGHQSVSQKQE
jgi:hypothetical protein